MPEGLTAHIKPVTQPVYRPQSESEASCPLLLCARPSALTSDCRYLLLLLRLLLASICDSLGGVADCPSSSGHCASDASGHGSGSMADAPSDRRGGMASAPDGIRGKLPDAPNGARGQLLGAPESLRGSLTDPCRNVTCALADLGRGMDIFLLFGGGQQIDQSQVSTEET